MRVDFEKWARKTLWSLEEGAALLLRVEPSAIIGESLKKSFEDICDTARRSIAAGTLLAKGFPPKGRYLAGQRPPTRWMVPTRHFLAFAREKGYPIPPELEEAVNRFYSPGEDRPQGGPKWPWGDYTTPLLEDLLAAAERFWKNYNPDDPTTARTNKEVTAWLMERGVSERNAEVIATILHDPRIHRGPRK